MSDNTNNTNTTNNNMYYEDSVHNAHDPFSDWSELINRPVYSIDGKKIGFVRKLVADYMLVKKGLVTLNKYFIPKSLAESLDKKRRIRLKVDAKEVHAKYSYAKMKDLLTALENVPEQDVKPQPLYDRWQTFRYGVTRNRAAAAIAFVSGILFLSSGYKANLEIYHLVTNEIIAIDGLRDFWQYLIAPIGVLSLLAQFGGITVLFGAGFFAANRVNIGKFLVIVGTGQGLFTIAIRILTELWTGQIWGVDNYVTWLTSSAAGLGILFAVLSQSMSKGKGQSISSKAVRFALRRQTHSRS
jgi:sporulation protein YlmC with PRC-barrel domain